MRTRKSPLQEDMPAWLNNSRTIHNDRGWQEWVDAVEKGNVELERPYRISELMILFNVDRKTIQRWVKCYQWFKVKWQ